MKGLRGDALLWLAGAVLGGLFVVTLGMRLFPSMWGGVWFWLGVATVFLWLPALVFAVWAFRQEPRSPLQELEARALRGEVDVAEYQRVKDEFASSRKRRG